ncbi:MAG: PAS domain S-box protein [bacterium]|nr:PAS domain S-box protein [bacterium]MCP5070408.1 PAS domain S-box protein [bacterium]
MTTKPGLSLRQTWTALVLFIVIVPSMLMFAWSSWRLYHEELTGALRVERQSNEMMRNHVEAEVKRLDTLLQNKSDPLAYLVNKVDDPQAVGSVNLLLTAIVEREAAIREVIFLSARGDVIAGFDPGAGAMGDRLLSATERRVLGAHWESGDITTTPAFVVPSHGRRYIGPTKPHEDFLGFCMAVPVGRSVNAVLIARVDVALLWPDLTRDDAAGHEAVQHYLLDSRGSLLTHVDGSDAVQGDLLTHMGIARAALGDREWPADESYVGILGLPVYGTVTSIPDLHWSLVSEVLSSTITQPIKGSLARFLLMSGLMLTAFVWLVLALARRTLKPIQAASEAIDRVAGGDYRFDPVPSGVRELDALTSGFAGMAQARKEAEESLRARERDLAVTLDCVADAVVTIDEAGEILAFSKVAEEIFGYTAEQMIGQKISRLVPEADASDQDALLRCFLESTESGMGEHEARDGLRRNGERFPMRVSVTELPITRGGKRRFVASCLDLTETMRREAQLRQSQKMEALGQLTGGIAHDYNNMLGVILGYSDLLVEALKDQPDSRECVREISRAAQRGAGLTKRLLAFSRPGAAAAEVVDLNESLWGVEPMLAKALTARIRLDLDLADGLWPVRLDPGELDDAVLNMSINAMHAMESGGTLTLKTRNGHVESKAEANGEYVLLSIIDTGCGMDAATKEQVFDPFFSTKGKEGSGLGLSQVYGFVERNGGTITVYSEPGRGSRFELRFPRYVEPNSAEADAEEVMSTRQVECSETILVVDDEPALLDSTCRILRRQGYTVHSAESGQRALEILQRTPVDVLISDVIMPGMNGYQLAGIVQHEYPSVKIQLASGYADDRHAGLVDETLTWDLLHKPYHSKDLLKRVRQMLRK